MPGASGLTPTNCAATWRTALGPGARYAARESLSLAFVAALQHLPPGRRAALVLCDVLGFSAAEAAEILDSSAEAVGTALTEARAMLAARLPPGWRDRSPRPGSDAERAVARRFADAFERGDADAIVAVLTDDAWLTLPPAPIGYRGRAAAQFLLAGPCPDGTRRFRLIPTRANGQPAFGCYLSDPVVPRRARAQPDRAHPCRRPGVRHHQVHGQRRPAALRPAKNPARLALVG